MSACTKDCSCPHCVRERAQGREHAYAVLPGATAGAWLVGTGWGRGGAEHAGSGRSAGGARPGRGAGAGRRRRGRAGAQPVVRSRPLAECREEWGKKRLTGCRKGPRRAATGDIFLRSAAVRGRGPATGRERGPRRGESSAAGGAGGAAARHRRGKVQSPVLQPAARRDCVRRPRGRCAMGKKSRDKNIEKK